MLTQARLKELLHYDPKTGEFTWLVDRTNGRKAGDAAGSLREGYRTIGVDGTQYYSHRLAVLYMTGAWPDAGLHVDHINREKHDNRWENLRVVSRSKNMRNRECFSGVYQNNRGRWSANMSVSFDTEEEARDFRNYLERMRDAYEARAQMKAVS